MLEVAEPCPAEVRERDMMTRGSQALLNAILGVSYEEPPKPEAAPAPRRVFARPSQHKRRRALWPSWYRPPSAVAVLGNAIVFDVADDFGISVGELTGAGRSGYLVEARAVVVKLLLGRGWSTPRVARQIGRSDHSTVINLRDNFPTYAARSALVPWSYERQRIRHGQAIFGL